MQIFGDHIRTTTFHIMHPFFKGAKKLHPIFRVHPFDLRCSCANQVRVQFGNNYSKGAKKGAKSGSNIRVQKILHGKKPI